MTATTILLFPVIVESVSIAQSLHSILRCRIAWHCTVMHAANKCHLVLIAQPSNLVCAS